MKILFEDEHVLVVDKPAGLPVLPEGWDKDAPYLVRQLEEGYGKIWVVHRLDKFTSGVMVFARTAETHRALNGQFEKHEVGKVYHAIAVGVPEWDAKTTKRPLRVNVGHKHRTMVDDRNGKHSETKFKVLKRYQANVLFEARPMTGRTHQVRVHAYALGYPLLGDVLYSALRQAPPARTSHDTAPETDLILRPALHAYSLSFVHPGTNKRMTFTAAYAEDFQHALKRIASTE